MVNILSMLLFIIAFLIIPFGIIYVKNDEKKKWNEGICSICGKRWRLYDTDSQGGRMYKCENDHYCDISYNVDRNYKEKHL